MESLRVGSSSSTQNVVHINPAEDVAISVIKSGAVKFTAGEGGVGFGGKAPTVQQAHITDASEAHAIAAVFSDTEVEAALDSLGATVNAIIAVLEAYGLTADA